MTSGESLPLRTWRWALSGPTPRARSPSAPTSCSHRSPAPLKSKPSPSATTGWPRASDDGKVYLDLSTSSPDLIRRIHAELAPRGIHVLDAPVSGGPEGARTGRLAIWVGGDRDVYERVKPALDAIGDQPYYVGPVGAGSVAKLVHNCAGYIIQTGLAEVFTMGVKAGVDPLDLWLAVRQGSAGQARDLRAYGRPLPHRQL